LYNLFGIRIVKAPCFPAWKLKSIGIRKNVRSISLQDQAF
jgi:hypothetical protein